MSMREVALAKRRVGRPSKLTAQTRRVLFETIAAGNSIHDACEAADIAYTTARAWAVKAEQPQARLEYVEFLNGLKKAEVLGRVRRVHRINRAAKRGVWQADAWVLERRWPELWGRRPVELTGPGGGPIETLNRFEIDLRLPPAERTMLP